MAGLHDRYVFLSQLMSWCPASRPIAGLVHLNLPIPTHSQILVSGPAKFGFRL